MGFERSRHGKCLGAGAEHAAVDLQTDDAVGSGATGDAARLEMTEQIVAALRAKGREVEYLRYEDEGHSLAKAKNRAHAYPRVLAFFQRHLGA